MSHLKGHVNYGRVSEEIMQILLDYGDEAVEVLNEEAQKSGEACAKELKSVSMSGSSKKKKYKSGWACKVEENRSIRSGVKRIIVHNKNKPQIAHLLEYGHANRDGGRTDGIEHIRPMEKKYTDEFVDNVKKRLEGGT